MSVSVSFCQLGQRVDCDWLPVLLRHLLIGSPRAMCCGCWLILKRRGRVYECFCVCVLRLRNKEESGRWMHICLCVCMWTVVCFRDRQTSVWPSVSSLAENRSLQCTYQPFSLLLSVSLVFFICPPVLSRFCHLIIGLFLSFYCLSFFLSFCLSVLFLPYYPHRLLLPWLPCSVLAFTQWRWLPRWWDAQVDH